MNYLKYLDSVPNPTEFQEKFVSLLDNKKSLAYYANYIGTSHQNISNWLQGITIPDTKMIVKLAKAFSVSTDWLLGVTNTRQDIKYISEFTGLPPDTISKLNRLSNNHRKTVISEIILLLCEEEGK